MIFLSSFLSEPKNRLSGKIAFIDAHGEVNSEH